MKVVDLKLLVFKGGSFSNGQAVSSVPLMNLIVQVISFFYRLLAQKGSGVFSAFPGGMVAHANTFRLLLTDEHELATVFPGFISRLAPYLSNVA